MGGSSAVFEGKMTKDTVTLTNLNLKGVNDGVLYATAFMLDSNSALIGTGRATYTKDVVPPKSAIIQSNISNFGKSNLDSLIIDMKVSELNCDYNLVLTQKSIVKTNSSSNDQFLIKAMSTSAFTSTVGDSVVLAGKLSDSSFKLKNINLSAFQDGLIEVKVVILDS
jgi:alanine-alpha-ketoisovalerate/valine-pyruvate aminotransferase